MLCTTLAYCGGGSGDSGSGLPGGKTIGELNADEGRALCEYIANLRAETPEHEVDCGDGLVITLGLDPADVQAAIDDCAADIPVNSSCSITVSQTEACAEANASLTDQDVCDRINDPNGAEPIPECEAIEQNATCE